MVDNQNTSKQFSYALGSDAPEVLDKVRKQFEQDGYQHKHPWYEHRWDVMWSFNDPYSGALSLNPERLRADQLVNHYPSSPFASKSRLTQLPFPFIPIAFQLPEETEAFLEAYRQHPEKFWVRKNHSHRGVYLTSPLETELFRATYEEPIFVQEFIHPPHLICNRRWDMGVFVLLTNLQPLRVYAYEDIVLRFCPKEQPEQLAPEDVGSYVVSDDYTAPWELDGFARYREKNRHSVDMLRACLTQQESKQGSALEWENGLPAQCLDTVRDIVEHHAEEMLQHCSAYAGGQHQFFELYRFDFVFDEQLTAHLMEVNFSPNLSADARPPLDDLFGRLIRDTFSLTGLSNDLEALRTLRQDPKLAAEAEILRGANWIPLNTNTQRDSAYKKQQKKPGTADSVRSRPPVADATEVAHSAIERCYSLHGACAQVSLPTLEDILLMETRLPTGALPELKVQADVDYRLDSDLCLFRDNLLQLRAQSVEQALDALLADLRFQFARYARTALFLHAGALSLDDRGILLPGRDWSTQTTLLAALVQAGASHYSQGFAILDTQARLHRYPRTVPLQGREQLDDAPDSHTELESIPVSLVIQTRFERSATWSARPVSKAEALLHLVQYAVQPQENPALMLDILTKIAGTATVIASAHDDTDAVISGLQEIWLELLDNES